MYGRVGQRVLELVRIHTHLLQQLPDQTVVLTQQSIQQMFLLDLLMAEVHRHLVEFRQSFLRLLGKFINIHMQRLPSFAGCIQFMVCSIISITLASL